MLTGTTSGGLEVSTRKGLTRHVAAAAAKKPLCAYLRLTVDRDGNKIGYDVQEESIRRWAEYAGETIGHVYRDKDLTAADLNVERPEYEQMLADVEVGMWGGIVVWRLDRLVRLMYEFERCYKIVDSAGGFIVTTEPVIRSDEPIGKAFLQLLVVFAEMEIGTMKVRARGHRMARAQKGLYNGGGPRPFGFIGVERDEDGSYLNKGKVGVEHHPLEAALLREAADRILDEGWSWIDVLNDWASRTPPVLGTTGKPMSVETLRRILTGLRIIGKREAVVAHPETGDLEIDPETGEFIREPVTAVWKPIITEKQWHDLRALIKQKGPRGPALRYLLSSFITCGRCRQKLTGTKRRYRIQGVMTEVAKYRCKSEISHRQRGACGALEVLAQPVERLVVARVLVRIEQTPELLETLVQDQAGVSDGLDEALAVVADCDSRLKALAAAFGARQITWDEWQVAREPLEADKSAAERRVESISRTVKIPIPTSDQRADLQTWYDGLTMAQQQSLVRAVVRKVAVKPGNSGPKFDPGRVVVSFTPVPKKATA